MNYRVLTGFNKVIKCASYSEAFKKVREVGGKVYQKVFWNNGRN